MSQNKCLKLVAHLLEIVANIQFSIGNVGAGVHGVQRSLNPGFTPDSYSYINSEHKKHANKIAEIN